MTRSENIKNEDSQFLLQTQFLAALQKAQCKDSNNFFYSFDSLDTVTAHPTQLQHVTNDPNHIISAEPSVQKLIFKRPIDKSKLRKINSLAQDLMAAYQDVKENTPAKRRRKMAIYSF